MGGADGGRAADAGAAAGGAAAGRLPGGDRPLAATAPGAPSGDGEPQTVEELRAALRAARAEARLLKFFKEASTATNFVFTWRPGTLYSRRLALWRGRPDAPRPHDENGWPREGEDGDPAADPPDDAFVLSDQNAAGREGVERVMAIAAEMGPGSALGFEAAGLHPTAPQDNKPNPRTGLKEGPIWPDNPSYGLMRDMRPYMFESMLLLADPGRNCQVLSGKPAPDRSVRFPRPIVEGLEKKEDAPDVIVICMDLPEPPDRPGVFGFAAVASRREYWALRQLQRALDSAEAANRAKNTFVATISHELRTPLTAILGFSNLLEGAKGLTPEEAGWVSMIKESGDSLANIIGDLIDVSKIEAGKMDVQLHPFSPREFLSSVHALHAPKTAELGITLDLVIAPADPSVPGSADVPEHIISDELRLRQILGNFLTNSRKFTPSGGHITVTARCFARPLPSPPLPGARRHSINTSATHTLRISVRDDGMGIAPDKIHVLFTEFTPGDASYARLVGGTGLGLFISKRLIGLLGGRIGVDSPDVGRGSEFWIEMDVDPVAAAHAARTAAPRLDIAGTLAGARAQAAGRANGAPEAGPGEAPKILVVEDNAVNVKLILKLLSKGGYGGEGVDTASNGVEAVDKVARAAEAGAPFDVVLMDIQMPILDGLEATRRIRHEIPAHDQPSIIALTANAMLDDRANCIAAGMDSHLAKPVKARDLYAAVGGMGGERRKRLLNGAREPARAPTV